VRIPLSRLALILVPLSIPFIAAAGYAPTQSAQHFPQWRHDPSPLIEKVRRATARFRDINVAMSEGWVPGTPCVSGPQAGAMGVHFVLPTGNPTRIDDGALNAEEPEALIYEPMANGAMRLVGVEFIVKVEDWAKKHPDGSTPDVDGNLTNLVPAPNRYGLPAFYELHVWAWENNPSGSFADWNTKVSCDKQAGD
jgi:hypothetical protein